MTSSYSRKIARPLEEVDLDQLGCNGCEVSQIAKFLVSRGLKLISEVAYRNHQHCAPIHTINPPDKGPRPLNVEEKQHRPQQRKVRNGLLQSNQLAICYERASYKWTLEGNEACQKCQTALLEVEDLKSQVQKGILGEGELKNLLANTQWHCAQADLHEEVTSDPQDVRAKYKELQKKVASIVKELNVTQRELVEALEQLEHHKKTRHRPSQGNSHEHGMTRERYRFLKFLKDLQQKYSLPDIKIENGNISEELLALISDQLHRVFSEGQAAKSQLNENEKTMNKIYSILNPSSDRKKFRADLSHSNSDSIPASGQDNRPPSPTHKSTTSQAANEWCPVSNSNAYTSTDASNPTLLVQTECITDSPWIHAFRSPEAFTSEQVLAQTLVTSTVKHSAENELPVCESQDPPTFHPVEQLVNTTISTEHIPALSASQTLYTGSSEGNTPSPPGMQPQGPRVKRTTPHEYGDMVVTEITKKPRLCTRLARQTPNQPSHQEQQRLHSEVSKDHWGDDIRKFTNDRHWRCECCNKTHSSKTDLFIHVNRFTHNWKFKCDKCPSKFLTHMNLQEHVTQAHTGSLAVSLRKFGCEECGRCFKNNEQLLAHIRRVHNAGGSTSETPLDLSKPNQISSRTSGTKMKNATQSIAIYSSPAIISAVTTSEKTERSQTKT